MPPRGIARSAIRNATSRWAGPSSFVRRSTGAPVKSFWSAHTQPSPAAIALVVGVMSLPWSG